MVLDGLRGVASLIVLIFHLFEAFSDGPQKQIINHGYLAVDFFFLLSGFVIAYAYDDRWGRLSTWDFYKRRLIRLQPMIIAGTLIGAVLWPLQDYPIYWKHGTAAGWQVLAVMVAGFFMIPMPASADIRGWGETYTLNGPAWSLLYEFLANILYAAGVRKLGNRGLGLLVALGGLALLDLTVLGPSGDVIGGWNLDAAGIGIGLTRVIFPFFAGVLLMRLGRRIHFDHAFLWCSILLVAALAMPRIGGTGHLWLNGIYEAGCIILLFPLIVAIGAGEKREDGISIRIARFFGDLSYPLYIVHYPLVYIYFGWVTRDHVSPMRGTIVGGGVVLLAILLAYACLRFYDIPVRRALSRRFLSRRPTRATG